MEAERSSGRVGNHGPAGADSRLPSKQRVGGANPSGRARACGGKGAGAFSRVGRGVQRPPDFLGRVGAQRRLGRDRVAHVEPLEPEARFDARRKRVFLKHLVHHPDAPLEQLGFLPPSRPSQVVHGDTLVGDQARRSRHPSHTTDAEDDRGNVR